MILCILKGIWPFKMHKIIFLSSKPEKNLGFTSKFRYDRVMPRSHIHGSPRWFYYGLNLTDDTGNANFRSPIRMHYIRMIKYYYV